jgi:hypothetical protein
MGDKGGLERYDGSAFVECLLDFGCNVDRQVGDGSPAPRADGGGGSETAPARLERRSEHAGATKEVQARESRPSRSAGCELIGNNATTRRCCDHIQEKYDSSCEDKRRREEPEAEREETDPLSFSHNDRHPH